MERKVTDKQEEEVRMIHVAMHLRQRRQSVWLNRSKRGLHTQKYTEI